MTDRQTDGGRYEPKNHKILVNMHYKKLKDIKIAKKESIQGDKTKVNCMNLGRYLLVRGRYSYSLCTTTLFLGNFGW